MSGPDLAALPRLPRDAEGPVFAEPWQAQAFALTLKLHEGGAFTWPEWAQALSAELATDPGDDGTLVTGRNLAAPAELSARKDAWEAAYLRTPHGKPVEL